MDPGDWIALAGIASASVTALGVLAITRTFDARREARALQHATYLEVVKAIEDMPIYAAEAARSEGIQQLDIMLSNRRRMTAALAELEIVGSKEVETRTQQLIDAINTRDMTAEVKRQRGGAVPGSILDEADIVERAMIALLGTEIDAVKAQIRSELMPTPLAGHWKWALALVVVALVGGLAFLSGQSQGPSCEQLERMAKNGGELARRVYEQEC